MEQLTTVLAKAKFFSIQADGTTDAANKEVLFLVVYFDPYFQDGTVHVQNRFLTVRHSNAEAAATEGVKMCTRCAVINDYKV